MKRITLTVLAASAFACGDDDVAPPASVLFESTDADISDCPNGGQSIRTGLDRNGDGLLQDDEVTSSENICSGPTGVPGNPGDDGRRALVRRSEEPVGDDCPNGGERIQVGLDDNADGALDDDEVDATAFVCRGLPGADGAALLTATSTDTRGLCPDGGTLLEVGLDENESGTLEPEEVLETRASCEGAAGLATLVEVEEEPDGPECAAGGRRITTGADENGDGVLADSEILDVAFVCDPAANLIEISSLQAGTSTGCPGGGQRIDQGIDSNGDGDLEAAEIQSSRFVCNGLDGVPVLATETNEPPGANCPDGGARVAVGRDLDADGVLDPDEEVTVSFVCDGAPGEDGSSGTAVRTRSEPPGPNCLNGGTRIETGTDANSDGVLGDDEVSATAFACDGQAATSLVDIAPEPPGANCPDGGRAVNSGPDLNADGVLDPSEIETTTFLCNTIASVSIAITTTTLSDALQGNAYGATLTGIGGAGGNYAWRVSAGALPMGLSLDPSGTPSTQITGVPSATGTFNFTVEVEDAFGNTATQALTLSVTEIFSVTSFTLPRLEQGAPYSAALSSTGNTGAVTWNVVSGNLPSGLSLSAAGVLSGTPTTDIGERFIVEAVDGGSGSSILVGLRIKGEQQFVFTCGDTLVDTEDDLVVYPLTGSTPGAGTTVTGANSDALCTDPAEFSTDGEFIAFFGDQTSGINELYVASTTATVAATRVSPTLATTSNDVLDFAWSSDGRFLAFRADNVNNFDDNLFVVDTDSYPSLSATQVNAVDGDVFSFQWIPNSSELVYVYEDQTSLDEEVRLADAANLGTETVLNGSLVSGGGISSNLAVSPDGDWVVYRADEVVDDEFRYYAVDISGVTPAPPVEVSGVSDPDGDVDSSDFEFSPSGRWLAFIANDTAEEDGLFAVDFDNGFARTRLSPVLNDSALDVSEFRWSPDSRRIALRADLESDSDQELYIADTEIPGSVLQVSPEPVGLQDVDFFSDEFLWSPDGDYVVYNFDDDGTIQEPFLSFLAQASSPVRLAGMSGIADDESQAYKVSDDGTLVFASLELNGTSQVELFLFDVDQVARTVGAPVNLNDFMSASSDVDDDYDLVGGGTSVLYQADPTTAFEDNAFIRDVSGGTVGTATQVNPTLPTSGDVDAVGVHEE